MAVINHYSDKLKHEELPHIPKHLLSSSGHTCWISCLICSYNLVLSPLLEMPEQLEVVVCTWKSVNSLKQSILWIPVCRVPTIAYDTQDCLTSLIPNVQKLRTVLSHTHTMEFPNPTTWRSGGMKRRIKSRTTCTLHVKCCPGVITFYSQIPCHASSGNWIVPALHMYDAQYTSHLPLEHMNKHIYIYYCKNQYL